MNGLLWILLLCCCGKKNGCGCSNSWESCEEDRGRYEENERSSCSLKEREAVWTPYTGNASERDNACGCEHNHNH